MTMPVVLLRALMHMKVRVGFRIVAMGVQMHTLRTERLAQHVDAQNHQHQRHQEFQT